MTAANRNEAELLFEEYLTAHGCTHEVPVEGIWLCFGFIATFAFWGFGNILWIMERQIQEQLVKEKRSGHQSQWAAQFAVASELCKRGYEVSFTMGNSTPLADLMIVSPQLKQMFLIDVKGLYRRNPWLVKRKPTRSNLFYVLAYVPTGEPNQFFVMTQTQVAQFIQSELKRLDRPDSYPVTAISWSQALAHRDAWDVLPEFAGIGFMPITRSKVLQSWRERIKTPKPLKGLNDPSFPQSSSFPDR